MVLNAVQELLCLLPLNPLKYYAYIQPYILRHAIYISTYFLYIKFVLFLFKFISYGLILNMYLYNIYIHTLNFHTAAQTFTGYTPYIYTAQRRVPIYYIHTKIFVAKS